MKMKNWGLLVAMFSLIGSASAYATQIGIQFEGVIYQADPMDNVFDWSELRTQFGIGDTISGKFYYNSDADVIWSAIGGWGTEILYAVDHAEVSMGNFTGYAPSAELSIIDNYYAGMDQYCLWADQDNGVFASGVSFPLVAFGFGIYDSTGTVFESSELPLTAPDLSRFDDSCFTLNFARDPANPNEIGFLVSATITHLEIIPEPATLLFLGFGGLALLRKRRK